MLRKRRSDLLVFLLLVLQFVLFSTQARLGSGDPALKSWMLALAGPALKTTAALAAGAERLWRSYLYFAGLYRENQALKRELEQLRLESRRQAEMLEAGKRLAELLELKQQLPYPAVAARILVYNPSLFARSAIIDKGRRDGIVPDCAVLAAGGVVGRVTFSTKDTAEVQLITAARAAAGVTLTATGTHGVISGTGSDLLLLNYVPPEVNVSMGEMVVTSGLDGIYPPGLVVGRILAIKRGSIFREIWLEPAVELKKLREVLVILKEEKEPGAGSQGLEY